MGSELQWAAPCALSSLDLCPASSEPCNPHIAVGLRSPALCRSFILLPLCILRLQCAVPFCRMDMCADLPSQEPRTASKLGQQSCAKQLSVKLVAAGDRSCKESRFAGACQRYPERMIADLMLGSWCHQGRPTRCLAQSVRAACQRRAQKPPGHA